MKKFVLALLLMLGSLVSAQATQTPITGNVVNMANISGVGQTKSVTVTVTNGQTQVTSSAGFDSRLNGIGGWYISLNGVDYQVSSQYSTSSLFLVSAYNGTSGSITATIYPVVLMRIIVDKKFTPNGADYVVQPGAAGDATGFYKQVGCTYKNGQIVVPTMSLDSMVDSPNSADRSAKYSAFFYRVDGSLIKPYQGFTSFQIPAQSTPVTWSYLSVYNAPQITPATYTNEYSQAQIDNFNAVMSARIAQLEGFQVNPEDYGAKGDLQEISGAISTNGTTFTATTAVFQPSDVGKSIVIKGAGAAVVTGGLNGLLTTTITGYTSSTVVTVAVPATVGVSGAYTVFYTDDTAAFTSALAALSANGGGRFQLKTKKYGITQVTIPNNTIFAGTGYKTTKIYSPFGQSQTSPPDGILKVKNPLNASTDANIELRDIQVNALNIYQYQAGYYDIGSTYVRIKRMWFRYSHWGTIHDQQELSSVEDSIFEAYDEAREFGLSSSGMYRAGLDPIYLGFTKVGTAAGAIEPMVFPDDCWQCGRWQVVGSGTDTPYWYRALSTNQFTAKGFFLKTRVPEVVTLGGGKGATTFIDDGVHRFEINWQAETGTMNFKINGGATVYTIGLSDELAIKVNQGGATATVVKTGTYVDTVVASGVAALATSGTPSVGFGDIDATNGNNSNTYWQFMEWYTSWPVATGSSLPAGDEAWQSREQKIVPAYSVSSPTSGGSIMSGDNQIICPLCNVSVNDVGKTIVITNASNRAQSVSGTVTNYYGDGFVWLTTDINAAATTIPVSSDPGNQKRWYYLGGESIFCTGTSGNNLTGCTRGLLGTTAAAHLAVDGKTVSINIYRTWVITTTASQSFDRQEVSYYPGGGPEFVNVIQFRNNQYNGTAVQIDDRGGYTHKYFQNNHNGGGTAMWISGSHEITIENEDFEGQTVYPLRIGGSGTYSATQSGSPFSIKVIANSIGAATYGTSVKIDTGSGIHFDSNSFGGGFNYAIGNSTNGSIGYLNATNNTTQGARIFQTTIGTIRGSQLGSLIPIQTGGGLYATDYRDLMLRPSSGPIELKWLYNGNEEEVRGALATISTSGTSVAISARNSQTQFYSTDVGKTIKIEYAGVPDGSNSVLTATITGYTDATHVTIDTAATNGVTLANAIWYRKGPVTPAITFYDAWNAGGTNSVAFDGSTAQKTDPTAPNSSIVPSNKWFRFQGLTGYTLNRTVNLLDASGTLGVTSAILAQNAWLTVDASHRITGDPAFASLDVTTGNGMLRYLNIKAATASGTQAILDISTSGGVIKWSVFYDNTGNWLTLQEGTNNRQMLTAIPNATYDYLQLHSNEGINWNGYSIASYSSSAGIARNANNVVEINRGLKIANGGATGDLILRKPLMQLSGASSSVYVTFAGTPTAVNTITIPDYAGTGSTLVTSNAALTAGRVPYNVAIGSGVGIRDNASWTFDGNKFTLTSSTAGFNLAISGLAHGVTNKTGTDNFGSFQSYDSGGGLYGIAARTSLDNVPAYWIDAFVASASGDAQPVIRFDGSKASGVSTVAVGATHELFRIANGGTSQWQMYGGGGIVQTMSSAAQVGQIIKLAAIPSVDAWQLQDSSATVLSRFSKEGWLGIGAAPTTSRNLYVYVSQATDTAIRVENPSTTTGARALFQAVADTASFQISAGTSTDGNNIIFRGAGGGLMYIWQAGNADMPFYTNNAEKMRLTAAGVLDFGSALSVGLYPNATGLLEINNGTAGTFRDLKVRQHYIDSTMTAGGTTGAQTINGKSAWSVNFAAAATSLVVTSDLVTTNSMVICTIMTNDSTLKSVQAVTAAGSVTLYANSAATAETKCACIVINK